MASMPSKGKAGGKALPGKVLSSDPAIVSTDKRARLIVGKKGRVQWFM
jgi:hypothetical protein